MAQKKVDKNLVLTLGAKGDSLEEAQRNLDNMLRPYHKDHKAFAMFQVTDSKLNGYHTAIASFTPTPRYQKQLLALVRRIATPTGYSYGELEREVDIREANL